MDDDLANAGVLHHREVRHGVSVEVAQEPHLTAEVAVARGVVERVDHRSIHARPDVHLAREDGRIVVTGCADEQVADAIAIQIEPTGERSAEVLAHVVAERLEEHLLSMGRSGQQQRSERDREGRVIHGLNPSPGGRGSGCWGAQFTILGIVAAQNGPLRQVG